MFGGGYSLDRALLMVLMSALHGGRFAVGTVEELEKVKELYIDLANSGLGEGAECISSTNFDIL